MKEIEETEYSKWGRVDEEELLGEVRNQKISFIHVKFDMNIRYQTTDVDSFVVYESLEFRGIVSSEIWNGES